MNILQNVAVQWLVRRIPEFTGLIVALVTFYNSMPAEYQATIIAIVTGQGGGLTIGALIGFGLWAFAQINSYRATVRPQTVLKTVEGTSVRVAPDKPAVVHRGEIIPPRRTLWDVLNGK
ncbi:MAG TPA: hypothetical protein VGN60_01280 [Devosia sp.]|jgi:hypothetical protein|nr:hypothetical protein [Devosia sp.]